ncbi:MAG: glycoside hydrolase family 13 protein [Caldicoprobacterales bacterium]|jgi:cyclomaltodextrinase
MIIEHNSRNPLYRIPFGAVPCLSTVVLRLFAKTDEIPRGISLVYAFGSNKPSTLPMHYAYSIARGSLYETEIVMPETTGLLWYYFIIHTNSQTWYYGNNPNRLGGLGQAYPEPPPPYQITIYKQDFQTPKWFQNAIIYQIFPDRFAKGDMDSFTAGQGDIIHRSWNEQPYYKKEQFGGTYLSNDFFGGNLDGILKKLPYLHDLGISAIYLNPIFKAYSNHKYDVGDYEVIDPMFGSNVLFQQLCREASKYEIRIILDGVFSHTGSNSKYFNKEGTYPSLGAYQSKESPYYPWYTFQNHPDDYESWWGFKTLPQTNELNPSFMDYILTSPDSIVKRWLHLGASGWRLDVADELPPDFIKTMRKEVKSVKPDAVLIGEVWEDASNKISYGQQREYLLGDELDSVMNYPLRKALINFACGHLDSYEFGMLIASLHENYPREAFYSLMNFLSTHDVERILTALGDAPPADQLSRDAKAVFALDDAKMILAVKRLENVVLLQMTLPGVPSVYYGDEVGLQGYDDPFNRTTYPWGKENKKVFSIYKRMINLRKEHSIFVKGDFEIIYMYQSCFAFARYDKKKLIVVSVNMNTEKQVFTRLDLARFHPSHAINLGTHNSIPMSDGIIVYDLAPLSYRIIEVDRFISKSSPP